MVDVYQINNKPIVDVNTYLNNKAMVDVTQMEHNDNLPHSKLDINNNNSTYKLTPQVATRFYRAPELIIHNS